MAKRKITCDVLLIGGSAGSLDVLLQLLPKLKNPLDFPLILILHRKYSEVSTLSKLLSSKTSIKVKEPEDKELIENNTIYIAPADYHLLIEHNQQFSVDLSEKVNYSRPSIDVTFDSAGDIYGKNTVAILLSGANADGVEGLAKIGKKKGYVIAQDPQTAQTPFMPQQAINSGSVDEVMTPEQMIEFINSL